MGGGGYRMPARLILAIASLSLGGCTTERIIEKPVPATVPSLCVTECPAPEGTPTTNGELAVQWRERGEAIACYQARQACVRELVRAP